MFVVRSRFLKAEGAWFDFEYFRTRHLPLILRLHARYGLLTGVVTPGETPAEFAVVEFVFRDEAGFCAALNDMEEILPDLARATNAHMDVNLRQEPEMADAAVPGPRLAGLEGAPCL